MGIIKAFNGDHYVKEEFEKLIKRFKIKTAVETGTYLGETTEVLAKIVKKVYTIESVKENYKKAKERLKNYKKVTALLGNSPKAMDYLLLKAEKPILFFLDAHWGRYWPILDELKVIAKHKCKNSVIVIHDFYVPNSGLYYDSYLNEKNSLIYWPKTAINYLFWKLTGKDFIKKQKLDYEYIKPALMRINPGYKHYYNSKSDSNIGVVYIHP